MTDKLLNLVSALEEANDHNIGVSFYEGRDFDYFLYISKVYDTEESHGYKLDLNPVLEHQGEFEEVSLSHVDRDDNYFNLKKDASLRKRVTEVFIKE